MDVNEHERLSVRPLSRISVQKKHILVTKHLKMLNIYYIFSQFWKKYLNLNDFYYFGNIEEAANIRNV